MYLVVWLSDIGQWFAEEFEDIGRAKSFAKLMDTMCYIICSEWEDDEEGNPIAEKLSCFNYSK